MFDSGKRVVGGRASTRQIEVQGKKLLADHSAQFFYAQEPEFQAVVDDMIAQNAARPWNGIIGNINSDTEFSDLNLPTKRYVGVEGIASVSRYLATDLNTKVDTWVSKMTRTPSGRWELFKYFKYLEEFDFVIISHNG